MTTANKHFVRSDTLDDSAPALASVTPFPRTAEAGVEAGPGAQVASSTSRGWPVKALIAALLAAIVGVVVWSAMRQPAAAPTAVAATPPLELAAVDVETVALQTLSRSLPLSGSMSPIVQATLKSKVGGEVELVPLREGQDVREGEVIARIDTRNLQAQYDRQVAAVERARADLDLATLNRDKNRVLLEKHYISQNTYEATESAYAGMRREPEARRGGCAPREDQPRRRRRTRAVRGHDRQATRAAGREGLDGLDHRDAGRPAPDGARSGGAGRRHSRGPDRPAGAIQGRWVRRARIRRRSAADQSDHCGWLARDHDLHRRAESEPRAERRHVRARRAHAGQDRARAGRAATRRP